MSILIPHDTSSDCQLRFSNCYATYEGKYLYIREIVALNDSSIEIAPSYFRGGLWENGPTAWFEDSLLELLPIKVGYINAGNAARFVSRSRGQSYRLGLCDHRVNIETVEADVLYKLGYTAGCSLSSIVPIIQGPTHRPPKKIVEMILKKQILSSSFSTNHALALSLRLKGIGVFRKNALLGEIDSKTLEVTLPYKFRYFKEELEELDIKVNLTEE